MDFAQKLTCCLLAIAVLFIGSTAQDAESHPHVYVDAALTFHVNESGLASLDQNWLFDEIFSKAILADLGLDEASLATTLGQAKIKDGAFAYLANYGYFTFIENNGQRIPVKTTENFHASIKEGRLVYDFTVPLNLPSADIKDFRVAIFDKEYYSDILLLKDSIIFEIDGMAQVSHVVRPAKDHTYWQFIVPEAVHLSISDTPGSATDLPVADMEEASLSPLEQFMGWVRTVQKELTQKLNGFGMEIQANPFGPALWMFLGLSFLYGVVHAVGPGHGKTVVCSYFLSNPGSFYSGAIMGNVITFVHMGSAAVAVGLAYLVFSTGMGGFAEATRALQPASYALLTLMGLFLVIKAIRDVVKGKSLIEPSCPVHTEDANSPAQIKRVLMVSFVTGLIPCPGAAVILAFSIGLNIVWAGMAAIVVMAIGMGLTTTLFAWGAVAARGVTLKVTGRSAKLVNWITAGLSISGALIIMAFGATLFMSSPYWHS